MGSKDRIIRAVGYPQLLGLGRGALAESDAAVVCRGVGVDCGHLGIGRARTAGLCQTFDGFRRSDGEDLDAAVAAIAHPSSDAKLRRGSHRPEAIADTLDAAVHQQTNGLHRSGPKNLAILAAEPGIVADIVLHGLAFFGPDLSGKARRPASP